MNTAQTGSVDSIDLEKLNDRDRAELQQFLSNERQRSLIQSQTHVLTHVCWNKCVTGGIKSAKLDRSEEACLANCVDRFLDMSFLTMKHLQTMRSS